jgi:Rad3-related DNA helicase
MNKLNKESSIYKQPTLQLPTFNRWLQILQKHSRKFEKYGSFLPVQEELLKQIYDAISVRTKSTVFTFTAPPASGKTHIIALCASYFHNRSIPTCVVVPNNELKIDFGNELHEVKYESTIPLPIISIGAYVRRRIEFEFAFIDEAHNLRSAIELDSEIVKSIHLEKGDPIYDHVLTSLDKNEGFKTKELSTETAHDILQRLRGSEYERDARQLLKTLSQWRGFCVVSDITCDLKFLIADPHRRSLLPKGRLFLFSATLLDQEELQFYCGISQEIIGTLGQGQNFVPKKNVTYRYTPFEADSEKRDFVVSLLKSTKLSTLILFNNNATCLRWSEEFSRKLGERVITMQSGLHYSKRLQLYREFLAHPEQILLTSSSAYWEGITFRNLRLLILPDLPIPQPSLLEIALRRHTQYRRIAKRRLIQGMGRIGRSPQEGGICLLLFRPNGIADIRLITKEKAKHLIRNLKIACA